MVSARTAAFTAMLTLAAGAALADSDTRASREHEMLRRAQEALLQTRTENENLARAKSAAELKLKTDAEQLQRSEAASKSAQSSLRAQLKASADARDDLQKQLAAARQEMTALRAKDQSLLDQRDAELKQAHQDIAIGVAANSNCEAKNLALYQYSRELLSRYQQKGVFAALSQKEPVLGLSNVAVENLVQEYQVKLEAAKLSGASGPAAAKDVPKK